MKKFIVYLVLLAILLTGKVAYGADTKTIEPYYTVPEPCAKYIDEISKYPWDVTLVIKVAYKESKCSSNAVNLKDSHRGCKGSFGMLQIGCLHFDKGEDRKNAPLNIEKAFEVYKSAGYSFSPWSVCKTIKGCL